MKIGIIGPRFSINHIRAVLGSGDAFIEFYEFPYPLNALHRIIGEVQKDLDAILFTGHRYILVARRYVPELIPWGVVNLSGEDCLSALLQASIDGHDLRRISHDLNSNETLLSILQRTSLKKEEIYLYNYSETQSYRDYLDHVEQKGFFHEGAGDFHLANLQSGKASVVMTCSESTCRRVQEKGYPAYYIQSSDEKIISAVNSLRYRYQTKLAIQKIAHKEAVIALKIRLADSAGGSMQIYQQLQTASQIELSVFNYAQSIGASFEKISDREYHLYASQADVEAGDGSLRAFDFIAPILSMSDVEQISIGIGFGTEHGTASENSRRACQAAEQQKCSCYYLSNAGDDLKGPFLLASDHNENHRIQDYDWLSIQRVSKQSGVGMEVLQAIVKAKYQYGFETFTASELADMCGLSVNNINRILIRLEDANCVQIVGMRSFAATGRPRRVFRLSFNSPANKS